MEMNACSYDWICQGGEKAKARCRVHRFDVVLRTDQAMFEQFLNSLEGEVVSVIPSVSPCWTFGGMGARTHYFWVIEKVPSQRNAIVECD